MITGYFKGVEIMNEPRLSIKGVLKGDTYVLFIHKLEKIVANKYVSGYLGTGVPVVEIFYDNGKSAYLGVYDTLEDAKYDATEIAKKYIEAVSSMECLTLEVSACE